MIDTELTDLFIQEAKEHLESLEPDLLSLEGNSDNGEVINRIFRSVHSIKGTSGFVGLSNITRMSHAMENLMSLVREGALKPNKPMIDALLAGFDKLRTMVENVADSGNVSIQDETARLEQIIHAPAAETGISAHESVQPKGEVPEMLRDFSMLNVGLFREAIRMGRRFYLARIYLEKDVKERNKTPLDFFKAIESIGEFLDSHIDYSSIEGLEGSLEQDLLCLFLCSTVLEADLLAAALEVPEVQIFQMDDKPIREWLSMQPATDPVPIPSTPVLTPVQQTAPAPVAPAPVQAAAPAPAPVHHEQVPPPQPQHQPEPAAALPAVVPHPESSAPATVTPEKKTLRQKSDDTIRVSVSLLDDLMNLAGEMVLGRNQLLRLASQSAAQTDGMSSVLQNISIITSELQEKVMRTRLQPLGSLFGKFTRIIRDLSHQLGKEIELKTTGEEVELDKSILEALSDPLTHLIRNCADHGIETPAERESHGKPRVGIVRITASHVGGQVLIQIIDDGHGIDPDKLKRKAIEKSLIRPEEAEKMTDRQALNLIFLPGFSTAAVISDVSGRGVGMDVVKTNIEKLGGSVDVQSEVGKGSTMSLRLPLTLAIVPAMIIGVQGRRFAVPQVNLEEVVSLSGDHRVESVRGSSVLRLRGRLLPLLDLREILQMPPVEGTDDLVRCVLVLKADQDTFGLIVDELLDNEEIVVKPLSSYLQDAGCYSGATIMGDGRVALILDTTGIAAIGQLNFTEIQKNAKAEVDVLTANAESQSILLFKHSEKEIFALNLSMVSRIEKIKTSDIERVGPKEYLKYRSSSLQLIRLHNYMSVSTPGPDPEYLYVIVPKLVKKPMGIIATRVVDAVQAAIELDEETIQGVGIIGSAVLNSHLTLFLDIYSLFEAVDPITYSAEKEQEKVDLKSKRILLAEDTPFFRAVELQYLKEIVGYVDVATNGIEAWDKLNKNTYDLLLTDVEMPGMNGFELTRKVRESEKLRDLPIVALTALSADRYVKIGREAGVDAYETKLDKPRLLETLDRILTKGRSAAQLVLTQ